MPYKKKEDRNEAVRRCRAKKKEEQKRIEEGEQFQNILCEYLTELDFETMPYRSFVSMVQTKYRLEGDNIIDNEDGEVVGDIVGLFGLNMLVFVETPHLVVPSWEDDPIKQGERIDGESHKSIIRDYSKMISDFALFPLASMWSIYKQTKC